MTNMMRIECLGCRKRYKTQGSARQKTFRCECGYSVVVPASNTETIGTSIMVSSAKEHPTECAIPRNETAESSHPDPCSMPSTGSEIAPEWVNNKSSQTVRIWCEKDPSPVMTLEVGETMIEFSATDLENMRRAKLGYSSVNPYRSGKVEVTFPPRTGRHVVDVVCPWCEEKKGVLVEVSDQESRMRFLKFTVLPLAIGATLLAWLFLGWFGLTQTRGWGDQLVMVFFAMFVGLFPAIVLIGIWRNIPGFEGAIANLLPSAEKMRNDDRDKIFHHAIGCVDSEMPNFLTWSESSEAWVQSRSTPPPRPTTASGQ